MFCIVSNFSYKTLRNDDLIHQILALKQFEAEFTVQTNFENELAYGMKNCYQYVTLICKINLF